MNTLAIQEDNGVMTVVETKTITTEQVTIHKKEDIVSQLLNVDNQLEDIVKLQTKKIELEAILAKFTQ